MGLNEAEQRLADALWARYRVGADEVLADVAKLFHITVKDITNGTRRPVFVDARSVVALILRNRAYTIGEIGHVLNRERSTVVNLMKRIERDRDLRDLVLGLVA